MRSKTKNEIMVLRAMLSSLLISGSMLPSHLQASPIYIPVVSKLPYICDESTTAEQAQDLRRGTWSRIKDQVRGTNLKYSIDVPTASLGAFNLDTGVTRESDLSSGGKYAGIDRWKLVLSTDLLSGRQISPLALAANYVTYIRQFNNRRDSFCRLPDNPLDKIPRSSEAFTKEIVEGLDPKDVKGLAVNDFIEFIANLTFAIPSIGTRDFKLAGPLAVQGDFRVQIFRMSQDLVRVRLSAIEETTTTAALQYSNIGMNWRIVGSEKRDLNLHVYDMVFNFNKKLAAKNKAEGKMTAAELYDQMIGPKMKPNLERSIEIFKALIKGKGEQIAAADGNALTGISIEDSGLIADQRRVILLNRGQLLTESNLSGILGRTLMKLLRFEMFQTDYESALRIYDEKNNYQNYVLHGTGRQSSWRALNLWGGEAQTQTNLIMLAPQDMPIERIIKQVDRRQPYQHPGEILDHINDSAAIEKNAFPVEKVFGMNLVRRVERRTVSKRDAAQLYERVRESLTRRVFDQITWTHGKGKDAEKNLDKIYWDNFWKGFGASDQTNVKITQNIYFKQSLFEKTFVTDLNIIRDTIRQILIEMAQTGNGLNAIPYSVHSHNENEDHLYKAWKERKYVEAFANDLEFITQGLQIVVNPKIVTTDRYKNFLQLTSNPLFMEIGGIIMIRLSKDMMADDIVLRVAVESKGRESAIGYFPNEDAYNGIRAFTAVLDYQSYAADRSSNMKYFIQETGVAYTLAQLMQQGVPTVDQRKAD